MWKLTKQYWKDMWRALWSKTTVDEKAIATIRPPIIFKYKPQFRLQVNKWKRQNLNIALELITKTELNCKSNGFPSNAGCHRALMRIAQNARNLS